MEIFLFQKRGSSEIVMDRINNFDIPLNHSGMRKNVAAELRIFLIN